MTSTVAGIEHALPPAGQTPGTPTSYDVGVPGRRPYAAEVPAEVPVLDDFVSEEDDEVEVDDEVEDVDDEDDAGELLDEEPRLSLR
jgi:hypothetical protein